MKRTILLTILAVLFITALIAVGFVWAQADGILSPRAYLPVVIVGFDQPTPTPPPHPPTPLPTSTPGSGP